VKGKALQQFRYLSDIFRELTDMSIDFEEINLKQ
jgi:hypothetical protein